MYNDLTIKRQRATYICILKQEVNLRPNSGDSRNKTRPAKVVVVANSKQKCSVRTHNVVKYTSKNFGYDYTLY